MSGRRIAIVASLRIFPAETGGHLRTAGIARSLARLGHEVRLYAMAGRREDYRGPNRPAFRVDAIETGLTEEIHLGLGFGLAQAATRVLRTARIWVPLVLGTGLVPQRLRETLDWADLCISDQPICVPVRGYAQRKPWLLLSHNLEYRLLEQSHWRERMFAPWLRRLEAAVPSRYRGVLTCADDDQRFFSANDPQGRCALTPVGCAVDPGAYQASPGLRERMRAELGVAEDETVFLFSGSRFQPNADALDWLRGFNAQHPAFLTDRRMRVLVVGTVSPSAWREGGLIATGRVPEMAPYFAAADAGLNPVTWGSGANVKLFEYLAARLPVMSTACGVRGIELEAGRDFHHFEPEGFGNRLDAWHATRDRAGWRANAQDVWLRHQASIDIQQVVNRAMAQLPSLGS